MPAMSAMPSNGLVGDSTQTSLVTPGRMAARTSSTSWIEAMVWSIPPARATRLKYR